MKNAYAVDRLNVWDDFVDYCVSHDLYGAENLSIFLVNAEQVLYRMWERMAWKPKT